MAKFDELKSAVEDLPEADYESFRDWFQELDDQKWDKEIETDSKSGKLDFLIKEADPDVASGSLSDI